MSDYVRTVTQLPKPLASRLPHLDLELTERCNNDCLHCCINRPAGDEEARAREMTTGRVRDILQQAAGLGCLQVRFTGGEPLLRPDFEELYLHARRLGMKVLLFTNACLLTPRLVKLFARIPPLVEIEVSVYGLHPESYEAVTRAPGSYACFRRGVDLLLEHRIPFIVKSALLPPNEREMDELAAWAETIPWMKKPLAYAMFFDLRHRRDDAARNRLIRSLRVSPQDGLAMLTWDAARYRKDMTEFASKFMGPPGDGRLFTCGACEGNGTCVDAYGQAQPCLALRAPHLKEDLNRRTLEEALDAFVRLRDLRATNSEYLRRCAVCFLRGFCEQCPAKSWMEHGTLDMPVEYLCEVAHAQARWLGWLDEAEHAWDVTGWREKVKTPTIRT